jgi:hypothetical protein
LRGALVTAARYQVGTVVCVQDKDMKQAWCLAASSPDATARTLMNLYGKRWGIECGLRDTKDLRFGMGLGSIHVSTPERRDRLSLLNAFASSPSPPRWRVWSGRSCDMAGRSSTERSPSDLGRGLINTKPQPY